MFLDKTGSSDFLHGIHDFANTFVCLGSFGLLMSILDNLQHCCG